MPLRTEDQVRNEAGMTLGFIDGQGNNVDTAEYISGAGQLTTFIQLGTKIGTTDFTGISDKPDGWLLPFNQNSVAIILEAKSEREDITKKKWEKEIRKNIQIANKHYSKVVGILYNGKDNRVFLNSDEVSSPAPRLQGKEYYIRLFVPDVIDKGRIYDLTKKINNCLHKEFGVKNLNHRMIFTACALVAVKEGAILHKGTDYSLFHQTILNQLSKSLRDAKRQNEKLDLLCEVYSEIKMNTTNDQTAIDNFIDWVNEISGLINSDNWNGEDVMAIFFNEFNRYKKKSERGQVFTPDHITSFMYRLIDVSQTDVILDAACGSGAFLVKSMCNMIKEAGGVNTDKAKEIKAKQLFGIEFDREIFALACANMLIHKDGKTNLEQLDSRKEDAAKWIRDIKVKLQGENHSKGITKVLMNPPFERAYGCMTIVKTVLDNVPVGTTCAFILPDKKLEKDLTDKRYGNKVLKDHRLTTIVKLPEKIFSITASIFIFETGKPQNGQNIIGYYIEEDGLETVKNQGRQDIRNKWSAIEDYWIQAIHDGVDTRYNTRQIINPTEHLSYQMPEKPFEVFEDDFVKTMMDYEMFKRGVDVNETAEKLLGKIMYSSNVNKDENNSISVTLKDSAESVDISKWKEFPITRFFELSLPKGDLQVKKVEDGNVPLITPSNYNNGLLQRISANSQSTLYPANSLTVDMFGNAYYHEEDFFVTAHGHVNVLIPRMNINKYVGWFMALSIKKMFSNKYNFLDMCTQKVLKNEVIKLPVDENGEPDWTYMETYIKDMENRAKQKTDILLEIVK